MNLKWNACSTRKHHSVRIRIDMFIALYRLQWAISNRASITFEYAFSSMVRHQFGCDSNWTSSVIHEASEISESTRYAGLCCMILGISRNTNGYDHDIEHCKSPYILHVTDFSIPSFQTPDFFNGRDFNNESLDNRTYDITIFPASFGALCEAVKHDIDLKKHVRCFRYFDSRPVYEDETRPGSHDRRPWILEQSHIWIVMKVKSKIYGEALELVCMNSFSVVDINRLKGYLRECKKTVVWNRFKHIYGRTRVFDDIFESDEEAEGAPPETKRRKTDGDGVPAARPTGELSRHLPAQDGSRLFGAVKYSLVPELQRTQPQFVVVRISGILTRYASHVYIHGGELGIKRIKIEVADERGATLVVYVRGDKLCHFLGLKMGDYRYFEDLDDAIKDSLESLDPHVYYGMVLSNSEVCPAVCKWFWEYSIGMNT